MLLAKNDKLHIIQGIKYNLQQQALKQVAIGAVESAELSSTADHHQQQILVYQSSRGCTYSIDLVSGVT